MKRLIAWIVIASILSIVFTLLESLCGMQQTITVVLVDIVFIGVVTEIITDKLFD